MGVFRKIRWQCVLPLFVVPRMRVFRQLRPSCQWGERCPHACGDVPYRIYVLNLFAAITIPAQASASDNA
jgi:hypothetical protein